MIKLLPSRNRLNKIMQDPLNDLERWFLGETIYQLRGIYQNLPQEEKLKEALASNGFKGLFELGEEIRLKTKVRKKTGLGLLMSLPDVEGLIELRLSTKAKRYNYQYPQQAFRSDLNINKELQLVLANWNTQYPEPTISELMDYFDDANEVLQKETDYIAIIE